MRILFMDDDEQRHKLFEKLVSAYKPGWEVTYAFTSQQAEDACRVHRFDIAFLDHDMGRESDHNGSMFATEILSSDRHYLPERVVVHSSNPDGANNMVSKFRSAGIPSCWTMLYEVDREIRAGEL